MSNNTKTYKELENEKTRGKKRYLERITEEREADKLIKDYEQQDEESELNSEPISRIYP